MIIIDIDNKIGFKILEHGVRIRPLLIFNVESEFFYRMLKENLKNN